MAIGGWAAADDPKARKAFTFTAGDVTIDVDQKLRDNWDFSSFRLANQAPDTVIRGIAVYQGGQPEMDRWYGYDKDGVIIAEGPLAYQDYPKDEKTQFEIYLGEKRNQIKRIKIAARVITDRPNLPVPSKGVPVSKKS
jgi:hypothetical protein